LPGSLQLLFCLLAGIYYPILLFSFQMAQCRNVTLSFGFFCFSNFVSFDQFSNLLILFGFQKMRE